MLEIDQANGGSGDPVEYALLRQIASDWCDVVVFAVAGLGTFDFIW